MAAPGDAVVWKPRPYSRCILIAFAWYRQDQATIDQCRDGLTMQTQGMPPWIATLVRLMPRASESPFENTL
jgi:hypothetical protein